MAEVESAPGDTDRNSEQIDASKRLKQGAWIGSTPISLKKELQYDEDLGDSEEVGKWAADSSNQMWMESVGLNNQAGGWQPENPGAKEEVQEGNGGGQQGTWPTGSWYNKDKHENKLWRSFRPDKEIVGESPVPVRQSKGFRHVTSAQRAEVQQVAATREPVAQEDTPMQQEVKRIDMHLASLDAQVNAMKRQARFQLKQLETTQENQMKTKVNVLGFDYGWPDADMREQIVAAIVKECGMEERDVRDVDPYNFRGELAKTITVEFRNKTVCKFFTNAFWHRFGNSIELSDPNWGNQLGYFRIATVDAPIEIERKKVFKTVLGVLYDHCEAHQGTIKKVWNKVPKAIIDDKLIVVVEHDDHAGKINVYIEASWHSTIMEKFPAKFFEKYAPYWRKEDTEKDQFQHEEAMMDEYPWDIKLIPTKFGGDRYQQEEARKERGQSKGHSKGKGQSSMATGKSKSKGGGNMWKGKAKGGEKGGGKSMKSWSAPSGAPKGGNSDAKGARTRDSGNIVATQSWSNWGRPG